MIQDEFHGSKTLNVAIVSHLTLFGSFTSAVVTVRLYVNVVLSVHCVGL